MSDEYRVKGSSIRSKLDFVRERFGGAAERLLREEFETRAGNVSFLDSAWYPFAVYDELNRSIADRYFGGDLARLREVGSFSAARVLTTVYKAFVSGRDFAGFLSRAAILHERFYSHGRMVATIAEDGSGATIHLTDAPTYSEADLQIAAGFYAGAAELVGLGDFVCRLEVREDGAHFDLRWAPQSTG